MYVTLIVSPDVTVLDPAVKLPALNKTPVVLSIVAEPPTLINAPVTVPEPVIENTTAADVDSTDGLADVAELNVGVFLLPEYVGALAKPASNQPVCDAYVSVTAGIDAGTALLVIRPITTAPPPVLAKYESNKLALPTFVVKLSKPSVHLILPSLS